MATATAPHPTAEKKTTDPKPAVPNMADQLADLDRQIEALKARKVVLNETAIHEQKLKISDLKRLLRDEEEKLELLTGKPSDAPKKARRPRTPSISDDILKDQILKVMANHGQKGMNAKQLAEKLNQDPIRVRKYIAGNPNALKRTGKGPGTLFFLP